jgi:hypothetical protein
MYRCVRAEKANLPTKMPMLDREVDVWSLIYAGPIRKPLYSPLYSEEFFNDFNGTGELANRWFQPLTHVSGSGARPRAI